MGNCQTIDAAALVIQHPSGKMEKFYWSISASEVMKMNPGHYVSLIIPLPDDGKENSEDKDRAVHLTRVKLLRPSDKLVLRQAYRLVTSQEVMNVLRERKYEKMKKSMPDLETESENQSSGPDAEARISGLARHSQSMRYERPRQRPGLANFAAARSKSWRPSLHSISEASI